MRKRLVAHLILLLTFWKRDFDEWCDKGERPRITGATHAPAAQTYSVVVEVPSVRSHTDPFPVGAVPHVVVGAPAPTPMLAPLTELLTAPKGAKQQR